MSETRKKIVCAMSGGVDSSVAAALLKNQGHNVVGVFMSLFDLKGLAQEDARKVAKKLGIPFYVLNFEKEFKKQVVNYFLKEYASGRTPNPCVECNRKIKFGLLLRKALEMGADYVVTGHYVEVKPLHECRGLTSTLFQAKDKNKDQSYFLYNLGQKQLEHILFPLGDYTKQEVRALARKWQLPYQERESEDLCFIPEKNHNEFLKRHLKLKPGKIICRDEVIGEHEGLPLYTIGQRKEIKLSGGPFWVIGMDIKKNLLKVTDVPNDPMLYRNILEARNVNWISGREPKLPLKVEVKIRYRHPAVSATVKHRVSNRGHSVFNSYWVKLNQPQRAVTPGQSVVFYNNNELLGGGIIGV